MNFDSSRDVLSVDDYFDLLNLHKIIHEARFNVDPNNRDIQGSPIAAKLARQALGCLIAADSKRNGKKKAESWGRWCILDPSRREWRSALAIAKRRTEWKSLTLQEREDIAHNLLAPFNVEPDVFEEFMRKSGLGSGT